MAEGLTRRQQAEQTKRMLFEKGREVLKDVRSFDDFVVEDITDACGVSKGTFYLYFKSKGAFFYNVKLAEVTEIRDTLMGILQNPALSTRESILAFVRKWIEVVGEHDVELGQNWLAHVTDEVSRKTTDPEGERLYVYHELLSSRVQAGIEAGEFVPQTPPERLARAVMIVLHGFDTMSILTNKGLEFDEWADYSAQMVDDGILRRWLAS